MSYLTCNFISLISDPSEIAYVVTRLCMLLLLWGLFRKSEKMIHPRWGILWKGLVWQGQEVRIIYGSHLTHAQG